MAESLLNTLRSTTEQAQKKAQKEQSRQSAAQRRQEKHQTVEREVRIASFVEITLPTVISELEKVALLAAKAGKENISKTWIIKEGTGFKEPTEELDKHRMLVEAAIGHFASLDPPIHGSMSERRDGYEDRSGRSDEGYWPYIVTDYLIDLNLSWAPDNPVQ